MPDVCVADRDNATCRPTEMTRPQRASVFCDVWYAEAIGADGLAQSGVVPDHVLRWAEKRPVIAAVARYWAGRRYETVVTTVSWPFPVFAVLDLLFGPRRRHVVLLEFIPPVAGLRYGKARGMVRRAVRRCYYYGFLREFFLRRVRVAQTLSDWETLSLAEVLALDRRRLVTIPFFMYDDRDLGGGSRPLSQRTYDVMVSGRSSCDWETAFQACAGQGWKLAIVCSDVDRARVDALVARYGVEAAVESEVSLDRHAALLADSKAYLLALREERVSSGQIRVMNAYTAKTPLVCSSVSGVAEYVVPDTTAVMVPPGDANAARAALGRLLTDLAYAEALTVKASRHAATSSRRVYLEKVSRLVIDSQVPPMGERR